MIIIPTEKRFDWKHSPIVLFILVMLNILIFFMYQSGDEQKIDAALSQYDKLNYLEVEWPIYQKYLSYKNRDKQLNEYKKLYRQQRYDEVGYYLLIDTEFPKYLYRYRFELDGINDIDSYLTNRERINELLKSVSHLAYGLIPNDVSITTLLTSQFLHGDIMHLLGNLFFLVICGFAVEAAIGHIRFLIFYLISGIAGGLLFSLMNSNSGNPLIGASGAISGVMAMYLGVFRFKKIEFFYWFFAFVGYFRAPALLILPLYIGKEIISFISDTGSNVAFMAHTGGFIAGFILMAAAYLRNPKMLNEEYIEEDQTNNPLQEKLAKVYLYIERFQFQSANKALTLIIAEYGINFELAILRYNLLRPEKNKDYLMAVLDLLKMDKLNNHQIKKIENIWLENPKIHQLIKSDDLYKLGWSFANLPNMTSAEKIFEELQHKDLDKKLLENFAIKLSLAFKAQNNRQKKQQYEAMLENLI